MSERSEHLTERSPMLCARCLPLMSASHCNVQVAELQKDVKEQLTRLSEEDRAKYTAQRTEFAVYVGALLHPTLQGELS